VALRLKDLEMEQVDGAEKWGGAPTFSAYSPAQESG
jgi:hypothetical protein